MSYQVKSSKLSPIKPAPSMIPNTSLRLLNSYIANDRIELVRIFNPSVFLDNDDGGLLMAQKLKEGYEGNLRATFCPKFYKKGSEIKGFDMNDCTLQEIQEYINHTMPIDKAIRKLSNDKSDEIFWQ